MEFTPIGGSIVEVILTHKEFLYLIFRKLLVILLSHLLLCSAYLGYGFVLPKNFIVLTLLDESSILNLAMDISLLRSWLRVSLVED